MKLRRNMRPPARLPAVPEHARSLDPFARVSQVSMALVFPPRPDGLCRCGCGQQAATQHARRQWATPECSAGAVYVYWLWKGDPTAIRTALWRRDKGVCARCSTPPQGSTLAARKSEWDGHHIIPVEEGGGRLGIDNFQTLCQRCHGTHHHGHAPTKTRPEYTKPTAIEKRGQRAARPRDWRTRAAARGHARRRR